MKTFLTAAMAVSLIASAGAANAAPNDNRGRNEQVQRQNDRRPPAPAARNDNRDNNRYEQRASRHYAAGRYQRPSGYKSHHWTRGERLPANYRAKAYRVDHTRYGLSAPPRGYQYTRVDNDVVLTAVATGLIASVIVGLFQ